MGLYCVYRPAQWVKQWRKLRNKCIFSKKNRFVLLSLSSNLPYRHHNCQCIYQNKCKDRSRDQQPENKWRVLNLCVSITWTNPTKILSISIYNVANLNQRLCYGDCVANLSILANWESERCTVLINSWSLYWQFKGDTKGI